MTRRRVAGLLGRLAVLTALAGGWIGIFAAPASAHNCNLRINPQDCQNTAWTIGSVSAVAAAATAAAVAAANGRAGAEEGEGEDAAAPGEAGGPTVVTEILDGRRAIEVLQEMGLVRGVPQPDGTVKYYPTGGFDELNSGGRTTFQETATSTDPTTGRTDWVQEATITRVGGIVWNAGPDGSVDDPVIIVDRTEPGGWQQVNELAPGIRAQGDPTFVQQATDAYNAAAWTNGAQEIIDDIGESGQQVRIRQEADPAGGNSYGASRPFDRFQNTDGTPGIGTGGNVWFDPNRTQTGDGSQPWHRRPPTVGFWHEMAHARDAAQGMQEPGTTQDPMMPADAADPDDWVINNREEQATSIGAYAGHTSDENTIRQELGEPQRGSYVL